MTVTLVSTTKIVTLSGVPARIWEGRTASGVVCHAYITRIAAREDADLAEFERELQAHQAPSPVVEAIPLRLLL